MHALNFFIWASLDDHEFEPMEPRPFGNDERHYNAILNRDLDDDTPSTATMTMPRFTTRADRPDSGFYIPAYFPDEDAPAILATAKDALVVEHLLSQERMLNRLAEFGHSIMDVPAGPSREVRISPDAYKGFYLAVRESGRRFADATREERESVWMSAMKAAVIRPGDTREPQNPEHWVAVEAKLARGLIPDFLDPEAYFL
jgi:hypothetical protein